MYGMESPWYKRVFNRIGGMGGSERLYRLNIGAQTTDSDVP